MSKINTLIEDFSSSNLISFLRESITSFKPDEDDLDYLFPEDIYDKYESISKIGEAVIDKDDLIVIASKTNEPLTERTGKKNQYEIAKKILKHEVVDASLFIFYDDNGNFRFSFVKANYLGTKRDFTDFKRYTYFVTPSQTNKTFIKQVGGCNFNSLDEIIQAFSVEPLNKQFYQDIAKSFYELIGGKVKVGSRNIEYEPILTLPSTPYAQNRKIYQEFGVRLIGRTIFCWFLKNKKSDDHIPLVPESWLSSKSVVDVNNQQHNYYHSVLEKLFFLVLNKKQNDRSDYDLPSDHNIIPFLNGGLFEAHPDDFFPTNSKGIHQIDFGLKIPNQWFKELFETLEQYNFTIDENSIYDAEVSIDPEMLGTIFENLLAEIDPDTEKSARKATGSFYTPREIVDYMVEQSLIQYLKTKSSIEDDELLLELFKEGGENRFNDTETKTILKALSDVKILDPACGSGAFPMGALHKIINALHKLDPDASWWKARQIENVPNALAKKMLKEKLDGESADYVRKLGIIQNSIYGVDIQPIASEISKLRSFLSLVIDETINDKAENRGIQALPNLEFKFVTANTLIGLEEKNMSVMDFGQTDDLQDQLKEIRNQYLQAYGDEKIKLKNEFESVQGRIFKNEIDGGGQNKRAIQLASWKPFSNESSNWFDPYWMYGIEKFDIVIGNPPFISYYARRSAKLSTKLLRYYQHNYDFITETKLDGKFNSIMFFLEKSIKFLQNKSVSFFVVDVAFNDVPYRYIRKYLLQNSKINKVIRDLSAFKNVYSDQILLQYTKNLSNNEEKKYEIEIGSSLNRSSNKIIDSAIFYSSKNNEFIRPENEEVESILLKIETNDSLHSLFPKKLIRTCFSLAGHEEEFLLSNNDNNSNFPVLNYIRNAKNMPDKYSSLKNLEKIVYDEELRDKLNLFYRKDAYNENRRQPKALGLGDLNYYTQPKLFVRQSATEITATYEENPCGANTSFYIIVADDKKGNKSKVSLLFLLGILNSKLVTYYALKRNIIRVGGKKQPQMMIKPFRTLPIPYVSGENQLPFERRAKQILELKKLKKDSSKLENEIDILVYKIYNISFQEVKIIDPEFDLNQEQYNNYQIN